jgi:hypothetical protein
MEEMVKEQVDKKEQEMRVLLDEKTSLFRERYSSLERLKIEWTKFFMAILKWACPGEAN